MIDKWLHYFEIYDRYFSKYVGKEIIILEIGIFQGGSLKMWKEYFGERCKIYAIDVNPLCRQFEEDNVEIFIGSQSDRIFLRSIKNKIPKVDILIDDGGHTMQQQIVSFEELFDHVNDNGIYLCEDVHTSYWPIYGGGYKRTETFMEYTKNLIDYLNAWHSKEKKFQVNNFTRSTYSIHYYDSLVVIEKRIIQQPLSKRTGKEIIPINNFDYPLPGQVSRKTKKRNILSRLFKKIITIHKIR